MTQIGGRQGGYSSSMDPGVVGCAMAWGQGTVAAQSWDGGTKSQLWPQGAVTEEQ